MICFWLYLFFTFVLHMLLESEFLMHTIYDWFKFINVLTIMRLVCAVKQTVNRNNLKKLKC